MECGSNGKAYTFSAHVARYYCDKPSCEGEMIYQKIIHHNPLRAGYVCNKCKAVDVLSEIYPIIRMDDEALGITA